MLPPKVPNLEMPEHEIRDGRHPRRHLEPEIAAVRFADGERDRTRVPRLGHRQDDERDRAHDRGRAGNTRRQLFVVGHVVPVGFGTAERTVRATEPEHFDKDDGGEEGRVICGRKEG